MPAPDLAPGPDPAGEQPQLLGEAQCLPPRGEGTITVPAIVGVWFPTSHAAALTSSSSSVSPPVESGGHGQAAVAPPHAHLSGPRAAGASWDRQV